MFVDTKFFASNYNRIHDISLDVRSTTSYKFLLTILQSFTCRKQINLEGIWSWRSCLSKFEYCIVSFELKQLTLLEPDKINTMTLELEQGIRVKPTQKACVPFIQLMRSHSSLDTFFGLSRQNHGRIEKFRWWRREPNSSSFGNHRFIPIIEWMSIIMIVILCIGFW